MKKNNNNVSSGGGMGICGVLALIFIVLKLLGVITWSWWWVLSPLWIGLALTLIVVLVLLIIGICGKD